MVKKLFISRLTYLLAFFTLTFLLGGQAFACLLPSPTEMRDGRSMACCADYCRMETTPQAAQQACEQSRTAISQHQVVAGPSTAVVKIFVTHLPDLGLGPPSDLPSGKLSQGLSTATGHSLPEPFHSVKLYLLIRTLLI